MGMGQNTASPNPKLVNGHSNTKHGTIVFDQSPKQNNIWIITLLRWSTLKDIPACFWQLNPSWICASHRHCWRFGGLDGWLGFWFLARKNDPETPMLHFDRLTVLKIFINVHKQGCFFESVARTELGGLFGAWWLYASFSQSCRRRLRLGIWPIAEPNSLEKIVELCKVPPADSHTCRHSSCWLRPGDQFWESSRIVKVVMAVRKGRIKFLRSQSMCLIPWLSQVTNIRNYPQMIHFHWSRLTQWSVSKFISHSGTCSRSGLPNGWMIHSQPFLQNNLTV